ncbi:MAG: hypothetical protein LKJ13_02650 [Clostridia bacterium]|nr:hypothetical protein [Clostridia bacterium]MCI2001193.1 hypothetical protein [Clostridia bacterium]MCI2015883.1 hypothetical protein [Clostridia bacterium]
MNLSKVSILWIIIDCICIVIFLIYIKYRYKYITMLSLFKYIGFAFMVILCLASVAIFINESYKNNCGYVTCWDSGDLLLFYGNLVSAFATIVALIGTIRFTKSINDRERKERIAPCLYFEAEPVTKECAILKNDVIFMSYTKFGIASSPVPLSGLGIEVEGVDSKVKSVKAIVFIEYIVKNIGAGAAKDINFTINNFTAIKFTLPVNYEKKFIITFNKNLFNKEGTDFEFTFTYSDIQSLDSYRQVDIRRFYNDNVLVMYPGNIIQPKNQNK